MCSREYSFARAQHTYWKVSMDDADYKAGKFLREAAKILSGTQLYQSLQTPRGISAK